MPEDPLYWLQSIDRPDLAFIVTDPSLFCSDFAFDIPDSIQEELEIERPEQVEVMVLVTISRENRREMTINLLGPLIINIEQALGRQIVLDPKIYPLRFPISSHKDRSSCKGLI